MFWFISNGVCNLKIYLLSYNYYIYLSLSIVEGTMFGKKRLFYSKLLVFGSFTFD